MDQIKTGKFIKAKRKEKGITQSELAEMLGVSDRAVSKWENGYCLPDASNMTELCRSLGITVNDLFSGETVSMDENAKKMEENLIEITGDKQKADRELLKAEIFIGILSSVVMFACIFVASFADLPVYVRIILIICGIVPFCFGIFYAVKIEQVAGYYECPNCHKRYVPSYRNVLFAMHFNRTRKMKCPFCHKKTWHKKVIQK